MAPGLKQQYRFTQPWLFETNEEKQTVIMSPPRNTSQAGDESDGNGGAQVSSGGPTGPGWVIELTGYHYFNKDERGGLC